MARRGGPRYHVLGRAPGPDRIHFAFWDELEAKTRAREVAALPGQSPVVIDAQRPRKVVFYFADGGVCTVLSPPCRPIKA